MGSVKALLRRCKLLYNVFLNIRGYTYLLYIKKVKKIYNQIIVIGDSHCRFFCGSDNWISHTINSVGGRSISYVEGVDKRFCVLHLGAATAYNLCKTDSTSGVLHSYSWLKKAGVIKAGDSLICCFGEIDIRMHVFKYIDDNPQVVIDRIIERYMRFIDILLMDNIIPIIYGPVGTGKDEWNIDENSRVGTEIERNKATIYFNLALKKECKNKNIGFFSLYEELISYDYRTKGEYYYDKCHLSQKARWMLEKELSYREAMCL